MRGGLGVFAAATWVVLGAIIVAAIVWYLASASVREKLGAVGGWIVLIGWVVLVLVAGAALFSVADCRCTAGAQAPVSMRPVPAEQWTPEARLTLARCLVGEGGWTARADHAAIAYALERRWKLLRARGHRLSFAEYIRQYSTALRTSQPSPRQQWVRALPESLTGRLSRYRDEWADVLVFVDEWASGGVEDPCPTAMHWDSAHASSHLEAVACLLPTSNRFYR